MVQLWIRVQVLHPSRVSHFLWVSLYIACEVRQVFISTQNVCTQTLTFPKGCYVMTSTKLSGNDRISGLIPYMLLKEVTEPGLLYADSIWFIYYPSTLTYINK